MDDNRASRILSDLHQALQTWSDIKEFDILPITEPQSNRSPVLVTKYALGIEMWAAKIVYEYAYQSLMDWHSDHRGRKGLSKTCINPLDPSMVKKLSCACLLIQPENYTIWNIRKGLVLDGDLDPFNDLKFAELVLSKHPKSPETFVQRKWLIRIIVFKKDQHSLGDVPYSVSNEMLQSVFQNEMEVCTAAAGKYACHYNAWSHRIWTLQTLNFCIETVLISELQVTQDIVSMHVSDHSGFHYRQFLLTTLLNQNINCSPLFVKELSLITDLILSYPGHEALWYHRRYVFHRLLTYKKSDIDISRQIDGSGSSAGATYSGATVNSVSSREILNNSKKLKTDLFNDFDIASDISSIQVIVSESSNKRQVELANGYLRWVQSIKVSCYRNFEGR